MNETPPRETLVRFSVVRNISKANAILMKNDARSLSIYEPAVKLRLGAARLRRCHDQRRICDVVHQALA